MEHVNDCTAASSLFGGVTQPWRRLARTLVAAGEKRQGRGTHSRRSVAVLSLDSFCPMVRHCQRQTVVPVILHSTPISPTPAESADENCRLLRLAYTSKTSVKCDAQPFTFRLMGWPKTRPRHVVALANVTLPKSLVRACTITPGLWHTATMNPCETDAYWICHQPVASS